MPRQKVYPRFKHDGREYLLVGTLMLSDLVEKVPTAMDAPIAYQRLKDLIDGSSDWYRVETRRELRVFAVPSGWALCLDDDRDNVMDFKWLEKKAERLLERVTKLIAKELQSA